MHACMHSYIHIYAINISYIYHIYAINIYIPYTFYTGKSPPKGTGCPNAKEGRRGGDGGEGGAQVPILSALAQVLKYMIINK